jgi:hypothetical protein
MGIWTRPLFVTSPDIVVRTADIPEHVRTSLETDNIERYEKPSIFVKETFTLGEFMDSVSHSSHIWGYWDILPTWIDFMKFIRSQNPDAPTIQFHFYCEEEILFYFECRPDSTCWYFQYSHRRFLEHFSVLSTEYDDDGDPIEFNEFKPDYYRAWYKTVPVGTGMPPELSNNMEIMVANRYGNRILPRGV